MKFKNCPHTNILSIKKILTIHTSLSFTNDLINNGEILNIDYIFWLLPLIKHGKYITISGQNVCSLWANIIWKAQIYYPLKINYFYFTPMEVFLLFFMLDLSDIFPFIILIIFQTNKPSLAPAKPTHLSIHIFISIKKYLTFYFS